MPSFSGTQLVLEQAMADIALKVDWNQVAQDMEITNGHAARMRYARFKNQMEGTVPKSRPPRDKSSPPKPKRAKTKCEKKEEGEDKAMLKLKLEDLASASGDGQPASSGSVASESDVGQRPGVVTSAGVEPQEPIVKPEPTDDVALGDMDAPGESVDANEMAQQSSQMMGSEQIQPQQEVLQNHQIKQEPSFQPTHQVKSESQHEYQQVSPQTPQSLQYSRPCSFSFSNDMMPQLSPNMYLPMMDDGTSHHNMLQDMRLPPPNTFYDPYMYQQEPIGVGRQRQFVKNEQPWDASYC